MKKVNGKTNQSGRRKQKKEKRNVSRIEKTLRILTRKQNYNYPHSRKLSKETKQTFCDECLSE
jgi:hypothetical protein